MKNIKPAVSAPNWFSMFTGVGEEHGITKWNGDTHVFHWASTIFKLAKEQRPEKSVGFFHNWGHLKDLIEKDVPDTSYYNIIQDFDIQSDGKIVIIGDFKYNGNIYCMLRLNLDLSVDTSFNGLLTSNLRKIAVTWAFTVASETLSS